MLPQAEICVFISSICLFYMSLRSFGYSKWTAFAAASPLFYSRILFTSFQVYADALGLAGAVASISFLLMTVAHPERRWNWAGLCMSTFAAYQIRPAYLFLIPLVPLLAVVLSLILRSSGKNAPSVGAILSRTLAVTIIPLVAFCGLRLAVVGEFGLSSHGGHNLIGISIQFWDKDLIKKFDPDLQPLASKILAERESIGPSNFRSLPHIPMPVFLDLYYNIYTYGLFVPQASEFLPKDLSERQRRLLQDRIARRLASATFWLKPMEHFSYYGRAFVWGIAFTMYANVIIPVLLILLFFLHVLRVLLGRLPRSPEMEPPRNAKAESLEFTIMVTVAGAFYLSSLLLVSLVVPPEGRFVMAASCFIPGILGLALGSIVRGWLVRKETENTPASPAMCQ
jgi:hypothetical protein